MVNGQLSGELSDLKMDTEQDAELDSDLFSNYNKLYYTNVFVINYVGFKVKCLKEILIFSKLLIKLEN